VADRLTSLARRSASAGRRIGAQTAPPKAPRSPPLHIRERLQVSDVPTKGPVIGEDLRFRRRPPDGRPPALMEANAKAARGHLTARGESPRRGYPEEPLLRRDPSRWRIDQHPFANHLPLRALLGTCFARHKQATPTGRGRLKPPSKGCQGVSIPAVPYPLTSPSRRLHSPQGGQNMIPSSQHPSSRSRPTGLSDGR
jgi:hypothetical protein